MTVPATSHSLRPFGSTFSIHLFHFTFWATQNSIKVWLDWNLMSCPDAGFWWFFFFFFWTRRKTWNRSVNKASMSHITWCVSDFLHALLSTLSPSAQFPFSSIICLNLFPLCFFPSCSPLIPHIWHRLQRWCHSLSVIIPRSPKRRKSNVFFQNSLHLLTSNFVHLRCIFLACLQKWSSISISALFFHRMSALVTTCKPGSKHAPMALPANITQSQVTQTCTRMPECLAFMKSELSQRSLLKGHAAQPLLVKWINDMQVNSYILFGELCLLGRKPLTTILRFIRVQTLGGKVYRIRGCYINMSVFGENMIKPFNQSYPYW